MYKYKQNFKNLESRGVGLNVVISSPNNNILNCFPCNLILGKNKNMKFRNIDFDSEIKQVNITMSPGHLKNFLRHIALVINVGSTNNFLYELVSLTTRDSDIYTTKILGHQYYKSGVVALLGNNQGLSRFYQIKNDSKILIDKFSLNQLPDLDSKTKHELKDYKLINESKFNSKNNLDYLKKTTNYYIIEMFNDANLNKSCKNFSILVSESYLKTFLKFNDFKLMVESFTLNEEKYYPVILTKNLIENEYSVIIRLVDLNQKMIYKTISVDKDKFSDQIKEIELSEEYGVNYINSKVTNRLQPLNSFNNNNINFNNNKVNKKSLIDDGFYKDFKEHKDDRIRKELEQLVFGEIPQVNQQKNINSNYDDID